MIDGYRYRHAACFAEKCMVVFGGSGRRTLRDSYIFSTGTSVCRVMRMFVFTNAELVSAEECRWTRLGDGPPALTGATLTYVGDSSMVLIGGVPRCALACELVCDGVVDVTSLLRLQWVRRASC